MKKLALLTVFSCILLVSCRQSANKPATPPAGNNDALELNKKIFATATKYNDPYTALYAAHAILILDSVHSSKYLDTLANLYGGLNMPAAALQIANKILVKNPSNTKMLELKVSGSLAQGDAAGLASAVKMIDDILVRNPNNEKVQELKISTCLAQNDINGALNITRKLYSLTNDPKHLFRIAYIQTEAGNLKDAEATMDQIEAHPRYSKDSVEFQGQVQGVMQKIPMEAAAIYLRGYMDIQKKRYPEAATKFREALTRYPNFYMAGKNLQALQQSMAQGGRR